MNLQQLRSIMPKANSIKASDHLPYIRAAMEEFGIAGVPLREAAFIAQIAHESGELRYMREIWGPTKAQLGYEGRKDLGNVQKGDGRRFMGRGPIQITGRANYERFGNRLGLPLVDKPELAESPVVGYRIAGAFWKDRGLNELADQGQFRAITKRINGGFNGLEERENYYQQAKKVLGI